jgi:hypothetical protein
LTRGARELALLRLVAQGLAGPRLGSPVAVARRLLCLQAQDYWSGLASVAVRCGVSLGAVEAEFDAATIIRAWPLRGTVHLLAAEDLAWLRELLAPRQLAGAALREARLGLDAAVIEHARGVAEELLHAEGPRSRAELSRAWSADGIDTSGQRTYHLIWNLSHMGTLVSGPTRAGQQLFALSDQWLAASPRIERAEALTRLAQRYFSGHGPAAAADLSRWANLTVADTKLALAGARKQLAAITLDDVEYLLGPTTQDALADCREQAEEVIALPHFDELLLGYRDRDSTLPPERDLNVFANRNGVPAPTVIYRGQVVATWKRPAKGSRAAPEVTPLVPLCDAVLGRAAARAAAISGRQPAQAP